MPGTGPRPSTWSGGSSTQGPDRGYERRSPRGDHQGRPGGCALSWRGGSNRGRSFPATDLALSLQPILWPSARHVTMGALTVCLESTSS